MTSFISATPQATPSDPTKRVNYLLGMVLGVDDFNQELAWLSGRDQWALRDLIGSGTAWGLAVSQDIGERGPEVRVSPGVAVTPRGQLVRVPATQCASLKDWLAANDASLGEGLTSLTLYVVLSYRDCLTDPVPIPGEPCRTEDDAVAPSRVADSFLLELRTSPPPQPEEDALRDLVSWLSLHVRNTGAGPSVPLETFLAALRAAVVPFSPPADPFSWPPGSPPDFLFDSSPPGGLAVSAADAPRYLRAALRVWTTELRARWRPDWFAAQPAAVAGARAPDTDCLLLAELDVAVTRDLTGGVYQVASSPPGVGIVEDHRPLLFPLRLLEEWMLAGAQAAGGAGPRIAAAGVISGSPAAAPAGFNNLRALRTGPGRLVLGFDGFTTDPSAQFGVQAIFATANAGPLRSPAIAFVGAAPGSPPGLALAISDGGAPVPAAVIESLQYSVQVTQWGAP